MTAALACRKCGHVARFKHNKTKVEIAALRCSSCRTVGSWKKVGTDQNPNTAKTK